MPRKRKPIETIREAARCGGCGEVFATVAALDTHRKTCRRPGLDEAKRFNTRPFPGLAK